MIPLKGDKAISPGQRPGCCCSRDLRPERAKAIIQVWASKLLPFQGANPNVHRPRALPWAGCLLAFQAVTSRIVYRTPILQLKLVNGVEHDVAVEGFGATELAGAGTYVAAFGSLLAEQVNGF